MTVSKFIGFIPKMMNFTTCKLPQYTPDLKNKPELLTTQLKIKQNLKHNLQFRLQDQFYFYK